MRKHVMAYYYIYKEAGSDVSQPLYFCGEKGIRTLGARESSTVFETAPFDHSGISPDECGLRGKSTHFPDITRARKPA